MQNQNEEPRSNDTVVPVPPIELGPEKISPPTRTTARPAEIKEKPMPADVKVANRTSQVVLFIAMAILAVILYTLVTYFV